MKFLGQIEVGYGFSQHLGPRFQHGDVTLAFRTADAYRFISEVQWPVIVGDIREPIPMKMPNQAMHATSLPRRA